MKKPASVNALGLLHWRDIILQCYQSRTAWPQNYFNAFNCCNV